MRGGDPWAERNTGKGSAEPKGHQRKNRALLCSPLQLEVGHSSLEEANSHAGILGHCLVKCLGTKLPMEPPGL